MKTDDEEIGIKARSVLWYLTFFGFAINYVRKNSKNQFKKLNFKTF